MQMISDTSGPGSGRASLPGAGCAGRADAHSLVCCGMSAALIAAGAFIKLTVPLEPYPMHFTMQWFFVLVSALLFGRERGSMSVLVYLVLGLAGLPVFASGGGLSYILRPTFGFLLGFLPAAWITGLVSSLRPEEVSYFKWNLLSSVCGLAVYYGAGMIYYFVLGSLLYNYTGLLRTVLLNCCLLTIWGDFLLCAAAAALSPRLKRMLRAAGQL